MLTVASYSFLCSFGQTTYMIARWLIASVLLLAGCGGGAQKFNGVDITGANYARHFELTDHTGAKRTLADYRGKVVAVFFGFTQCPDVCPTTLNDLAQVKKRLGSEGEKLQVIFITVDPERDSQAVLQRYVPGFDPSFVALYGSAEQTAATAKEFKVFYQKVAGKTPTSYSVDHTAGTYVFDREGRVRLFVKHGEGVDPLVADLKRLLS
jgi:protein SCO1/2